MADATTVVRTSKRKRHQISYLADDYFESLDIQDADGDAAATSNKEDGFDSNDLDGSFVGHTAGKPPKLKKIKAIPKAKKAKAVKPFRFMDLPAELRDHIYDLALTEPSGITVVSRTRDCRRIVERRAFAIQEGKNYSGKAQPGYVGYWNRLLRIASTTSIMGSGRQAHLCPSLCAVSKQLREEASTVLYKQEIILEDTTALHVFINTIGSFNRQLLADITVMGWGIRKSTKGENYAAFSAMTDCTNLHSLFLECSMGMSLSPVEVAQQIYKDLHLFLEAYGSANGSYDAGVDLLELSEFHFKEKAADDTSMVFSKQKYDNFQVALRSYLKPKLRR